MDIRLEEFPASENLKLAHKQEEMVLRQQKKKAKAGKRKNRPKSNYRYLGGEFVRRREIKYNLPTGTIQKTWEAQNRHCAICEKDISLYGRKTHVDHDHKTGEFRGLLCSHCNHGIGYFDNPYTCARAGQYLFDHNQGGVWQFMQITPPTPEEKRRA